MEGEDYFFLTPEQFAARRESGDFLECKEYAGNWYGTLQSQVTAGLAEGKWVILEIDVEGTLAVLEKHPEALTIFVHSGSVEELERRLRARNTESEEALARRLATASRELAQKSRYRYEVINRDVPQAVREVCDILLTRHANVAQDLHQPFTTGVAMLDALKEESIVNKVGGRFKLSTLIQKRLVQLNAGSRPLVDQSTQDKMAIVLQEIIQDKIYLDATQQVRAVGEFQGTGEAMELDLGDL